MSENYHVIHTHPCSERIAVSELKAAQFSTIWLAVAEEIRTKHGRHTMHVPVFPGYIFVKFDDADDGWKVISRMRGVRRFLGVDQCRPDVVRLSVIQELQSRFDAGEFRIKTPEKIKAGEHVYVKCGPLSGRIGVCSMSKGERIKILMEALGNTREVEIWSGNVERSAPVALPLRMAV